VSQHSPRYRHTEIKRQIQLPLRNALKIAWQNIRVRMVRSMLVTSGIILAIAFLAYILCSEALSSAIVSHASPQTLEALRVRGVLAGEQTGMAVQTRWMVGLALIVSFIGVLNAMMLSVTERFREIGTMKCLGALNRLIVELFLLESLFQGLVGTTLGIAVGMSLALVEGMGLYGLVLWELFPAVVLLQRIVISLVAGMILTIGSALYPSWRAAKMQPVDAMRLEV
jgi:hypothetical protein